MGNQEAAQDLSVAIALRQSPPMGAADVGEADEEERRKQLAKAYFLRAKTRLARLRVQPARADVREAWKLEPPEDTAKELSGLEKTIALEERRQRISNKRLRSEICKLADAAMSNLTSKQLASFGQVEALRSNVD